MIAVICLAIILVVVVVMYKFFVFHSPRDTSSIFPKKQYVIAHRGGSKVAPENTMAAFKLSSALGVPFELDTMLSRDGQFVVFHDKTLERTTDGEGRLVDKTAVELAALDAGSHFSHEYSDEGVQRLEDVLDSFADKQTIIIEVKCKGDTCNEKMYAKALVDLLERKNLKGKVLVASFNPFILAEVKKADPSIFRAQIYSDFKGEDLPIYEKVLVRNLLLNRFSSPDALMVNYKLVDEGYVAKMHDHGYKIFVWTVDEPDEMRRLLSLGVDGIITNEPVVLLGLMSR
jgi:glycerophosphoryl diester phosphodiesterase